VALSRRLVRSGAAKVAVLLLALTMAGCGLRTAGHPAAATTPVWAAQLGWSPSSVSLSLQ